MKQNLKPIQTTIEAQPQAEPVPSLKDDFAWPQPALALAIVKERGGDRRFVVVEVQLLPSPRSFILSRVLERTHHRDLAQEAVGKAARNLYPRAKT